MEHSSQIPDDRKPEEISRSDSSSTRTGPTLVFLTGQEFLDQTGVGNHVSFSAMPLPTSAVSTSPPSDSPSASPGSDAESLLS